MYSNANSIISYRLAARITFGLQWSINNTQTRKHVSLAITHKSLHTNRTWNRGDVLHEIVYDSKFFLFNFCLFLPSTPNRHDVIDTSRVVEKSKSVSHDSLLRSMHSTKWKKSIRRPRAHGAWIISTRKSIPLPFKQMASIRKIRMRANSLSMQCIV